MRAVLRPVPFALSACLASLVLFAQAPRETDRGFDSFVGFTLGFPITTTCGGSNGNNGRPSAAQRAMVLDLDTRHEPYELLSGLPSERVSTDFVGWLSDRRSAIIHATFQPPQGTWTEDFLVNIK